MTSLLRNVYKCLSLGYRFRLVSWTPAMLSSLVVYRLTTYY